jgi:acyl-CoA thioesterase II
LTPIQTIVDALTLEPIDADGFRGRTPEIERNHGRIFGGQVIAQALTAAYKTVAGRPCHSLHAYFIRPGDPKVPVLYEVERTREGRSFATRRVVASQHGAKILTLAASFHAQEPGLTHATPMEATPPPEELPRDAERWEQLPQEITKGLHPPVWVDALEMRSVEPMIMLDPTAMPPRQRMWFRAHERVGSDPILNQCLLAYVSDVSLVTACGRPHGLSGFKGDQLASLDHAIWFHERVNMSDWMLYDQDSPWSGGARGFNRGTIYRRDGVMVANVAQEGLMRPARR